MLTENVNNHSWNYDYPDSTHYVILEIIDPEPTGTLFGSGTSGYATKSGYLENTRTDTGFVVSVGNTSNAYD